LVIAFALGILERALEPFPEALAAYRKARNERQALPAHDPVVELEAGAIVSVN
jgi:hypothetical protein